MQTSTHLAALFVFIASGCSAYLWSTRLPLPNRRGVRVLAGLVIWELLQLLPVHILAALQISGVLAGVNLSVLALIQALVLAGSIAWVLYRQPSRPRPAHNSQRWPAYLLWTAAVLAGSYALFALNLFTSYPEGSDAVAYHLPLALHWLQRGSLAIPATKAWRFSMPGNAEIGMMLLLATGSQSSVVLVNWIALAVLGTATYLLARRLSNGNRIVSATVVLLLLSIPMVEFQAFSAYVDLFGTAFLLAAFTLYLYSRRNGGGGGDAAKRPFRPALLLLSAAACGISLGTKPVYDLYTAAYAGFAIFTLWKDSAAGRPSLKARVSGVLLIVAGLLLPSIFWFARGYQAARNPLFPMRIEVGGHVIFAGYSASTITKPDFDLSFVHRRSEWLIYPWTEWKRDSGYPLTSYGEGSGLGAVFASLVPVGISFILYRGARRRASKAQLLLLVVLLASSLAWWFVLHRVPRFGLPIVVLTCIMSAPLISILTLPRNRAFRILLVSSAVITCCVSSFVPFHELAGRVRTGRWKRSQFYGYPHLVDRLHPGSCIVNATKDDERNFSLAGEKLTNCVIPGFEATLELSPAFLQQNHVGYIAEIIPKDTITTDKPLVPNSVLVRDETIKADDYGVHWRIWAVTPVGAEPAATSPTRK